METTIKVDKVYFVRYKKLKSGRKAIRNLRMVQHPNCTSKRENGEVIVDVTIDHKDGAGKMTGRYSPVTSNIKFEASDVVLKGYLKGRNYELVGYGLSARHTNLNTRRKEGINLDTRKNTGPRARW